MIISKNLKLLVIAFLFMFTLSAQANSQSKLKVFFPGEEIEYEVTFMGIKLGNITITSIEEVDFSGKKVYSAKAEMKSNPGIPFVSLHALFETLMEKNLTHSHQFKGSTKHGDNVWTTEKFDMKYPEKHIVYELWKDNKLDKTNKIEFDKKVNDGCSLFFFARQYTDLGRTVRVPTLINAALSYTNLNFHGRAEKTDIKAVKYPIKTLFFDGRADWEGVYGLKGYFKGWFSDDDARVPIKAEMNVYVGNVDIELVRWKRGNWQPPKAN
jgi:hypothetical protein